MKRLLLLLVCATALLCLLAAPAFAGTNAQTPRPLGHVPSPPAGDIGGSLQWARPTPQTIDVNGTEADDTILIHQNTDGSLTITINDSATTYAAAQVPRLVIWGKGGKNTITADASVTVPLQVNGGPGDDVITTGAGNDVVNGGDGNDTITTGAGNDTIDAGAGNDIIYAGAGNDRVLAGAGNDYVDGGDGNDWIDGGSGNDTLYGLAGNDALFGGDGDDYLDGGPGYDAVSGGSGNDILFGGLDADLLMGGPGNDLLAGGAGTDFYDGGSGNDRSYAQQGDILPFRAAGAVTWVSLTTTNAAGTQPGSSLSPAGDPAFVQRVASDVEALRSVPAGRQLLTALDNSLHIVYVDASSASNTILFDAWDAAFLMPNGTGGGTPGTGSGTTVNYNPAKTVLYDGSLLWEQRPPIVGLYHELIHSWNGATGTMQSGFDSAFTRLLELQCVGLPMPATALLWDNDGNPATAPAAGNPPPFTENDCRAFLGLPARPQY